MTGIIHHRRRVDAVQRAIVDTMRELGATVLHLHTVGHGCPDLLVGYRGITILVEIKSLDGQLTDDEDRFIRTWRGGQIVIIHDQTEAVELIQSITAATRSKHDICHD